MLLGPFDSSNRLNATFPISNRPNLPIVHKSHEAVFLPSPRSDALEISRVDKVSRARRCRSKATRRETNFSRISFTRDTSVFKKYGQARFFPGKYEHLTAVDRYLLVENCSTRVSNKYYSSLFLQKLVAVSSIYSFLRNGNLLT